jgi:Zn-dependent protease with chaperone function
LVLATTFLFLSIYLTLLAVSAAVLGWAVFSKTPDLSGPGQGRAAYFFYVGVRVGLIATSAMLFAFLFKGFFKRGADETAGLDEITEEQQPDLFRFIHRLCQEIRAPLPARVYLTHEVNAAVFWRSSVKDLVVPPRKNLLIGLGLVNSLNLIEFKALLAHEFGHFSQRSLRLSGYARMSHRVLVNMVYARDRWDDWVIQGFDTPWLSAFAVPLYALVELNRGLLARVFQVHGRAHASLLRHMEFNADLVAVVAAGSDAPVNALQKSEFCEACLRKATQDLSLAAETNCYTRDVFFHQEHAAETLRGSLNVPNGGLPPEPGNDRPAQVFRPGDSTAAAMWADHPSPYDRELNAKRKYFRSPRDDRPARILIADVDGVRAKLTLGYYHAVFDLKSEGPAIDPEEVQAYLDEERAALVVDARYLGAYDNRWLQPGELGELVRDAGAATEPGPAPPVPSAGTLYGEELRARLAARRQHSEEAALLERVSAGRVSVDEEFFDFRGSNHPNSAAADLLAGVRTELEDDRRYLADFDRSVFLAHYAVADSAVEREELRQRYDFHLKLQQLVRQALEAEANLGLVVRFLHNRSNVRWEEIAEVRKVLAVARGCLAEVLDAANGLHTPAVTHVTAGQPLRRYLPPAPAAPDPDADRSGINVTAVRVWHRYVTLLADRLGRMQSKSLNGILAFQAELVAKRSAGTHADAPGLQGAGGAG